MKPGMIMPQEVEVFYLIPAVRRELALAMKAAGKRQNEIAKMLCVRESTVSQYLNGKRAAEFRFGDKIRAAAKEAAEKVNDKVTLIAEMQKLLDMARDEKMICEVHTAVSNIPKTCDVCFTGAGK